MDSALMSSVVKHMEAGRPVWVVTVVHSSLPGIRLGASLLLPDGEPPEGSLGDPRADRWAARRLEETGRTRVLAQHWSWPAREAERRADLLVERLVPPPWLLVVGAGSDAPPVVAIAAAAGCRVAVADHRPAVLTPQRFPAAERLLPGEPETFPTEYLTPHTYAVLMTHNFLRDARWLGRLLASPVPYIGLLGPRARGERLLARVQGEGVPVSEADRARLYTPVGLDLGGEGAGAVALSIVSEVVAHYHGKRVPNLRDRRGALHPERAAHAG